MKTIFENQVNPRRHAFTLIELLVVIAIIAVLAALTLSVVGGVSKTKKISVARSEMDAIETALENYKAKYGVYPPDNPINALVNQLYYELSGVTNAIVNEQAGYQTLDAASAITSAGVLNTFHVGGIVNSYKGSGEDMVQAKDFLPDLKSTQITSATNTTTKDLIYYLATSVGGPDADYQPGYAAGFTGNPFRYVYPGTNNPNSYDLWVDLSFNKKINRVSNWSTKTIIIQ